MAEAASPGRLWSRAHWLLIGVLLLSAGLRLWELPSFPLGVEHDEVAEVLIAESILRGEHALYFQEAYGQEPLFLYFVAATRALMGRNVLALRFVAASVGLLTVAASARLAWRMFGERVALITASGVGVSLWAVFWSRVGLRGMLLPLTMCLGVEALWTALQRQRATRHATRYAILAGFWFGLSAYTYLAARGVPLVLAGWLGLLWLFDRRRLHRHWRELGVALLIAALVAAPLVLYILGNKTTQTRVYEVDAPLQALLGGDVGPVLANVPRILGMFLVRGDATPRNNLPERPVFVEPVWSVFFVIGLIMAAGRVRDPRYSLLWVWMIAMLAPSLVTIEAPNFVRALGALPVTMLFLGIGAQTVWLKCRRLGCRWGRGFVVVLVLSLGLNVGLTIRDYAVRWPQNAEVPFVWQWDFVDMAAWLDQRPEIADVTVAGLSNRSMDAPSLALLMKRDNVDTRWCDSGSPLGSAGAVLLPSDGGMLLVPQVVPLADSLAKTLDLRFAATVQHKDTFDIYKVTGPLALGQPLAQYEGGAVLLDFDVPAEPVQRGQTLTALSMWRAQGEEHADLKAFVHLVDATGDLHAQHDGLDCPSQFWRAGDVILQLHLLWLPDDLVAGPYVVRVGLYDRETLAPYLLLDGMPSYEAGTIEVIDE